MAGLRGAKLFRIALLCGVVPCIVGCTADELLAPGDDVDDSTDDDVESDEPSGEVVYSRKNYNVVFVMCDDLNDYEGVFGGHPQAKTPNIDRIAQSGIQFVTACTNVPVSQPSRNSLFTGVHPIVSEDFGWTARQDQKVLTNNKPLMQLFRENGYTTYGTGKLTHDTATDEDYDLLWDNWGIKTQYHYGPYVYGENDEGQNTLIVHRDVPAPYREIGYMDGSYGAMTSEQQWVNGWDYKLIEYNSDDDRALLADELHAQWAVEQLEAMSVEPFFLGVGFCRPHTPLHAPQKYFDMFPLESLELDQWFAADAADTYFVNYRTTDAKGFTYYETILDSYNHDRDLALRTFLQAYLACVAFVDEQIGKVWDALQQSPYRDDTIFLFTSDHGWQMGEKDFLFKNSPWEESARVPMVICHPDISDARQVEQPVSLVDIYPTLVDCCALSGENKKNDGGADLSGSSMLPLLYGDPWDGGSGALTIVGNLGANTTIADQHLSYRTAQWRYIRYRDGAEELYNHDSDSYEWNNLADNTAYADIKAELKAELFEIVGSDLEN